MKNLIKQYKARIVELTSESKLLSIEIDELHKKESVTTYEIRDISVRNNKIETEGLTLAYVISDLEKQLEFDNLDYSGFIEWLEEQKEPYELDESDGENVVICPTNEEIDDRVFSTDGGFEIH